MGEPTKHPSTESPLTALESWFRGLVREEVQILISQNGHEAEGELLTAKQAGERWNIPASKIKAMARQGEIPSVRLGHYVRFSPADLARFIESHKE